MTSCTGQRQHQLVIFNPIDQEPVRQNVAFAVSDPVAGKRVILVLFRQCFSRSQELDDTFQQFDFQAPLDR